jgi:hypothetical protein
MDSMRVEPMNVELTDFQNEGNQRGTEEMNETEEKLKIKT